MPPSRHWREWLCPKLSLKRKQRKRTTKNQNIEDDHNIEEQKDPVGSQQQQQRLGAKGLDDNDASNECGQPSSDQQTPDATEPHLDPSSLNVEQESPASKHNSIWNRAYKNLESNPERREYKGYYDELMFKVFPDKSIAGEISQGDDRLQFISEQGLLRVQGISKVTGRLKNVAGVIENLGKFLDITLGNIPQTALPWAIVSSSLQMLVTVVNSSDAFYTGVTWVLKRMDWYSMITDQLLRNESDTELAPIHKDLEQRLVGIYEEFLFYQIKSVCWFHRNQALALSRRVLKFDDWESDLKLIKTIESPFRDDMNQYKLEQINSRLQDMGSGLQSALNRQQHTVQEKRNMSIMSSLFVENPQSLMQNIKRRKDDLIPKVHGWIFDTDHWNSFTDWDDPSATSFLCLNGLAGSGKTMMVIGIVERLIENDKINGHQILKFFFQGSDTGLNTPSALLRCLMWSLLCKRPDLIIHLEKEYVTSGEKLFESKYGFDNLSPIFTRMLQDFNKSHRTTIIVDALDECIEEEQRLVLKFLQGLRFGDEPNTRTKVLVSGRPSPVFDNCVKNDSRASRIRFEDLNLRPFMDIYIDEQFARRYPEPRPLEIKRIVAETIGVLKDRAEGMFHWTSLIIKQLEKTAKLEDWVGIVEKAPTELMRLYEVIFTQLETQTPEAVLPACKELLALVVGTYRPLTKHEISLLLNLDIELCSSLVSKCESFLTMQNDTVYPLHHTAQQYLKDPGQSKLDISPEQLHGQILQRSFKGMGEILKRNLYGLPDHCIAIQDIKSQLMIPNPNPLDSIEYSCRYWAQHLSKSGSFQGHIELIREFFHKQFLHWLEAMGLLGLSSKVFGILDIVLKNPAVNGNRETETFLLDAERFVVRNLQLMETVPLQVYISALIFSPQESICRLRFHRELPAAISRLPKVELDWGPLLRTFDNCDPYIVQFSPDGKLLATASMETLNIWSTTEWDLRKSLKLSSRVNCVAFSPQERYFLAAGSDDGFVIIWDTAKWKEVYQWDHSSCIETIGFSCDNKRLFVSSEWTVWVSDIAQNCSDAPQIHTPKEVEILGTDLTLSPTEDIMVTICDDQLRLTEATTLNLIRDVPLPNQISGVKFSPNGKHMAVNSDGLPTWFFETDNGITVPKVEFEICASDLSISRTGQLTAASTTANHITLFDMEPKGLLGGWLEGHGNCARRVAFSPTQDILASSGDDRLYVATRAWGSDIILWDAKTGNQKFWLNPESADDEILAFYVLQFSLDGEWLLAWSYESPLKVWSVHSDKPELEVSVLGYPGDQAFFDEEGLVVRSQDGEDEQRFAKFKPGDNGGTGLPDFEKHYMVTNNYIVDAVSGKPMIWLPAEHRPFADDDGYYDDVVACYNKTIVWGTGSGRVHFMDIEQIF